MKLILMKLNTLIFYLKLFFVIFTGKMLKKKKKKKKAVSQPELIPIRSPRRGRKYLFLHKKKIQVLHKKKTTQND